MIPMNIVNSILGFLGRSVRNVLVGLGSLIVLLVVVAIFMPDTEGDENNQNVTEQRDSDNSSQMSRIVETEDGNTVVTGYDDAQDNDDAALDVQYDEQSTVVLGE